MKRLSRYVEALRLGAVIDGKAPAGGALAGTTVVVPMFETVQIVLTASSASLTGFVADNVSGSFILSGVSAVFGTASSSGTLQVEVATGTQAVASGTNQLTGTMSLAGTPATTVNGTLNAVASLTTITAGSRVNLIIAGTMTNLANCVVTLALQRVA